MGKAVPVQKITLRMARCNLGLSLKTVAAKLGVDVHKLEEYERDSRQIPCDEAIRLFRLYKISSMNVYIGKE